MKWSELIENNYDEIVKKMIKAFESAEGMSEEIQSRVLINRFGEIWNDYATEHDENEFIPDDHFVVASIAGWKLDYNLFDLVETTEDFGWIVDEYNLFKQNNVDDAIQFSDFAEQNYYAEFNHWHNTLLDIDAEKFQPVAKEQLDEIIEQRRQQEMSE